MGHKTLHSTMLLLYRHLGKKSAVVFQPLHSTMLLLYHPAAEGSTTIYSIFTFHYASTISDMLKDMENVEYLYIPLCFYYIATV